MEREVRDKFKSRLGFILACVGSAVGMGNIWMFPYRVGEFGGAAFLIPYFIFVILLGVSGVTGEMAFGRAMCTGPLGAFDAGFKQRNLKGGKIIGIIPVLGSLGIAVGYSVVLGWFLKYILAMGMGQLMQTQDTAAYFQNVGTENLPCYIIGLILTFCIMALGVSKGIEKINKLLMPIILGIFFLLMIYIALLPNSIEGYKYLFLPKWEQLKNVKTWVFALGQAFFSLSLAGSGTIVYGSYLDNDVDIIKCAKRVALFDTVAALLASLVIIPAVFIFNGDVAAGPALIFISLPSVFQKMPLGNIVGVILFMATFFAAITSLINLYETPIEAIQTHFKLGRKKAVLIVAVISAIVGIFLQDASVVGVWMDWVSIYIIPLGALLAAVTFFWICPKGFARNEVEKGHNKKIGKWFEIMTKYVLVTITLFVYILGILYGGIG